jgi:DNA-binding transcriptional ArsR family regulator
LARDDTTPERLAWIGRLISHPTRVRILGALYTHNASATQLADEFGEPMTAVAYHVRLLVDQGALALVSEQRVRGGLERVYRMAPETRAELDKLGQWPPR